MKELKAFLVELWNQTQGKVRAKCLIISGKTARAQERKLRAATKREISAVIERMARGTISTVPVGTGDEKEIGAEFPISEARTPGIAKRG